MVRIGWMADAHINDDPPDGSGGSYDALWEDINTLDHEYGVEEIYFTGDLVCPADNEQVPHAPMRYYDEFWRLVANADDPDLVRYCTPGNHEAPLATFLRSDPRCVLRAKVEFDEVVFLLPNTQAHAHTTGAPGYDGSQGGMGTNRPHMPYGDIKWLDDELEKAGEKTTVILPHAATIAMDAADVHLPGDPGPAGRRILRGFEAMEEYEICQNHQFIHEVIREYDKVVVGHGHWQYRGQGGGGSLTIDGVHYLWTEHYWGFNADASAIHTFNVIDADANGVTVTEVEHDDGTEYETLDVTW